MSGAFERPCDCHTYYPPCVGVSHRGRATVVIKWTPRLPVELWHGAVWLCTLALSGVGDSALCRWLEVIRCVREGPGRERKRGEEGSYLAKAVHRNAPLFDQIPTTAYIHWACVQEVRTVWWELLETTGPLFGGTAMTCQMQSLFPVLGLCTPFFKVTLDFWSLSCLITYRSRGLGGRSRVDRCFSEAGGCLNPPGETSLRAEAQWTLCDP